MAGSAQATVTRAVFKNTGGTPIAWEVQDGALPADGWYSVAPTLGVLDPGATQALEFTFHCDVDVSEAKQHVLQIAYAALLPPPAKVRARKVCGVG